MVAVGLAIFFSVSIFKIYIYKPELHFYEHDPSKSEKFYCGSC